MREVANSVMLQLPLHDFYNTVVKSKYKLYIASGSAALTPPSPKEKFWSRAWKKQSKQRRTFSTSCYFQSSDIYMFVVCCFFSWRCNPFGCIFHSPVASFSLLILEVS